MESRLCEFEKEILENIGSAIEFNEIDKVIIWSFTLASEYNAWARSKRSNTTVNNIEKSLGKRATPDNIKNTYRIAEEYVNQYVEDCVAEGRIPYKKIETVMKSAFLSDDFDKMVSRSTETAVKKVVHGYRWGLFTGFILSLLSGLLLIWISS